jgi:hypothetical protein
MESGGSYWKSLRTLYPLRMLNCMGKKRRRELSGPLLQSREASDRNYNPQFPPPTSC